jgi:L-ascorbate metabolism protein UlaG (beta-lactamase superfamily)
MKESKLSAKWLGHSTVLLQIGETTILTDPVFTDRIGVSFGPITVGPRRLVAPAMTARQIPRPDLILLSHAHFDHFDLPSLRALEHPETSVVTAANTTDLLRSRRYRSVHELGWGEVLQLGPVKLRAFRVAHWGARMLRDTYRGYNAYEIEADGYRVIFGGDTAATDAFRPLKNSKPWDLAIMPIGAYDPWINAHCTPEQALRMANDAGAEFVLPVHHQTFVLSREPSAEPIERFRAAMGGDQHRVALGSIGEEFRL